MAESFEPKLDLGHRVVVTLLTMALLALGVFAGYQLIFGDELTQTISPSALREVVEKFREKRRQRMIEEIEIMRADLAAIREIRDRRLEEIDLAFDPDEVLTDEERLARQGSNKPLQELAFHEVFEAGKAVEQDMITVYREFLAARMKAIRPEQDYLALYEHAATPRPQRPALDQQALYREITSTLPGEGLDAFKSQITLSVIECREMMENCRKLLEFTRKTDDLSDAGMAVDLDEADASFVGYRGPELMPDEMDFTYDPDPGNFRSIPGRRLVGPQTGALSQEWLYVDTWWVIGPFPSDRRRENLDTRFGPEANVNLNDTFTGKDDKKIGWRFTKVGWWQPANDRAFWKIEPSFVDTYAVYYAFTEIYSDRDRDEVWIATATDDYGKLWINDELVWQSPKRRKPYNATENVQQVSLRKGRNKVLYRVENGGGTMGFSLLIHLAGSR